MLNTVDDKARNWDTKGTSGNSKARNSKVEDILHLSAKSVFINTRKGRDKCLYADWVEWLQEWNMR